MQGYSVGSGERKERKDFYYFIVPAHTYISHTNTLLLTKNKSVGA